MKTNREQVIEKIAVQKTKQAIVDILCCFSTCCDTRRLYGCFTKREHWSLCASVERAEQILALTYPSGNPMIGMLEDDQTESLINAEDFADFEVDYCDEVNLHFPAGGEARDECNRKAQHQHDVEANWRKLLYPECNRGVPPVVEGGGGK